jgi:CheY-like chemotaxis protein
LLLTDVVMPGMNGRETAGRLREIHPGVKVVFMSGYTGSELSSNGKLDPGTPYLQKPFNLSQLAETLARAARE